MRNIFKNRNGQVRWGYRFLSIVLIWEVFMPVFLMFASVGIMSVLLPLLNSRGLMGADGLILPEYSESINAVYFVGMMCVQNAGVSLICIGVWKRMFHMPLSALGYKRGKWVKELGIGFLTGAVMISLVCLVIYLTGGARLELSRGVSFNIWLLLYLVMFIFVGFGEETAFRGYAMGTLRQTENPWLIVLLPAVLFGVAHSTNANFSLLSCVNIILAGIFIGLLYWKSGRLWLSIGFHIAWNYFQGCVYGFEVSGIETKSMLISSVSRPGLLNGGAFGPEGSIPATVVLLAGIGALLWYYRNRGSGFMD